MDTLNPRCPRGTNRRDARRRARARESATTTAAMRERAGRVSVVLRCRCERERRRARVCEWMRMRLKRLKMCRRRARRATTTDAASDDASDGLTMRCDRARRRPLNARERAEKVPEVIEVDEHGRTASARRAAPTASERASTSERANARTASGETRDFVFDDVFGPTSTQERVYDSAVRPMVRDVLDGTNCTVFAYGQTGTGKTHTMSGAHDAECDVLSTDAGVIPRAMMQVFEHLESKELEHTVKVTYLELYNEEITDLLSAPASSPGHKHVHALMEDGKGGVAVKGLEEVYVSSTEDVFAVLNRGNARRRTEETLLNKHSSRSHSVFSVTVHIKDVSPDGEEFVRCGKLNLVDLAGSENISRSGATHMRAKEAGEINKSLVALGRVITALVDKSAHVPYRDSKLTRLLRDALGGRCRTCIIATVSPASHSIEETLSTLEYAHRAKNIKNKPPTNGKVPKSVFLKDLQDCIERLQDDLLATREKNGVFLSKSNYDAEQSEHATARRRAEELENALASMQAEHDKVTRMFDKTKKNFLQLKEQHAGVESALVETKEYLRETESELSDTKKVAEEKEYLLDTLEKKHDAAALVISTMAEDLGAAQHEAAALFDKIARQESVATSNTESVLSIKKSMGERLEKMVSDLAGWQKVERDTRAHMKRVMDDYMSRKEKEVETLKEAVMTMAHAVEQATRQASEQASSSMLQRAERLEQEAKALRADSDVIQQVMVQNVVVARRGRDETVESLLRSLTSDREAFSDLAETVADTSERGHAEFVSKHVDDLGAIRKEFTNQLTTAIKPDLRTGTTPAREHARVMLAEPVTPSAFTFNRDEALSRRTNVDAKRSRPPLSPIGGSRLN